VFHAPFITTVPGFALRGVMERSKNLAAEKYPGILTYRSIHELLNDPAVELVVITTPNNTHFDYSAKALQAGKHVILEKPFTIESAEAEELLRIAAASGKVLSVYHNRRYVSDIRTIAQLIREGWLGNVHEYECHFDRYRPEAKPNSWREEPAPGAGILYDLGSHLIDQALCLFGIPQFITADIRMQRPHAVTDDYFDIRLDYGFTRAILKGSMLVREMGPRYMVHGTKGSYIKHGDDPQEALLKQGALPLGPDWGKEPDEIMGLLHTERNGAIIREKIPTAAGNFGDYYRNLYDTLVNGKTLKEMPEHGYNSTRMIELALESSASGKRLPCTGLKNVVYPAI
jgi:predicted dehydrogenase